MKRISLAIGIFLAATLGVVLTRAQVVPGPPDIAAMICAANSSPPTPTNGSFYFVQCDSSGHLLTNAASGGGTISGVTAGAGLTGGGTSGNVTVALSYTGATLNGVPTDPASTTSSTPVMMGLGVTTCRVTPVNSSRMDVTIDGTGYNPTASGLVTAQFRWGIGTGPANGAAAAGTAIGNTVVLENGGTTGLDVGFSRRAIITGLTPGTTIWFDIALSNGGTGTASIRAISCTATET